jgi:hypothetical protein
MAETNIKHIYRNIVYYACDMYLNGMRLNQRELVPHFSVTRFGLEELTLSDRNKIEMKLSALRSPERGE